MKKYRTYKFRLYPSEEQKQMIAKTLGCVRFLHNKMLEAYIEHYKLTKRLLNQYPDQLIQQYEWLNDVDKCALIDVFTSLKKEFVRSNKVEGQFPSFKKKKECKDIYTTYNIKEIIINDKTISLPKIGEIPIVLSREIPIDFKLSSVSITHTKSDKYYALLLFQYQIDIKPVEMNKVVGIDYSMKHIAVTSDGLYVDYPKFYKQLEDKLAKENKKLSRKQQDSKNYDKQRIKVARVQEAISNQRKYFLHNLSRELVDKYDVIVVEDLDMEEMARQFNLAKGVYDNSFGMLQDMLKYKLEDQGKKLIKIDKWFPSSKTCSACGSISEIPLAERVYKCECGNTMDRDLNAAINIMNEGYRLLKNN